MKIWIFCGIASIFSLAAWVASCKTSAEKKASYFLNHHDTVDYVGIDACKQCHAGHFETFLQTGMGQSFGLATMKKSSGIFGKQAPVYDASTDRYYYPFWKDSALYIKEFRLKGNDTVFERTEKISYIIGSGHHTNSHFYEVNGFLYQAPLTFYTQKGRWDLPPGYEGGNNIKWTRKIDLECMSCHNAMPKMAEGGVNKFAQIPLGIDCERCHGPGELHVNEKRMGKVVDTKKEADRTIVNPSKLPWKLQVDICQRCHLQGNNVLKPGKDFDDFRPGMPLSDVFEVFMPTYENKEYFVMAGHAERFQMSACFKASNPADIEAYNPGLNFTCITCHDPHVSVRKTNLAKFNNTCEGCHSPAGKSKLTQCSEEAGKVTAQNRNCVGCHMPTSDTRDIPHVTVHDHYIRKRPVNSALAPGKPIGIYAVNEKKVDGERLALAFLTWYEKFEQSQVFLDSAALRVAQAKENVPLEIHFRYVNNDFGGVVKLASKVDLANTDAWTAYRIGKSFDMNKQLNKALIAYETAYKLQQLNLDFGAEYGNALIRNNQGKEAYALLIQLHQMQPKHTLILTNLGRACMLIGRISDAQRYLKKSLSLDPDDKIAKNYLLELERAIK